MSSPFEPGSKSVELELTLQAQRAEYATVALAVLWLWDLLISAPEELFMISGVFLAIPNFGVRSSQPTVAPANRVDCHSLLQAAAWLLAFSTPCNALLFLIRIRGIFLHSPKITWIFALLWSTTFASILTPLNFIGGQFVLANRICLVEETRVWAAIGFITVLIFDTAVFVTISIKVLSTNMAETWGERARIFFGRKHLGRLSKVLLHSGQQFYLVTIGVHLLIIATLLIPGIPSPYRGTLAVVTGTFHNIMACRVFKLLKFGLMDDVPYCVVQTQSQLSLPQFMSLDSSFTRTNLDRA
ncbi:hypothetical protein QCA50_005114 [Cerrena zonata]|uniref:G-protein coupled receptors family 1 profile domain-containing protein n=1 Tax=Cerrena zonata TaxID=2478898 RepID=A0AAW0GKN7_9APHY